jgi:hypothetical protein
LITFFYLLYCYFPPMLFWLQLPFYFSVLRETPSSCSIRIIEPSSSFLALWGNELLTFFRLVISSRRFSSLSIFVPYFFHLYPLIQTVAYLSSIVSSYLFHVAFIF